jgi:ATP-dependent Clp protease ATP-binding subunit ClpC
MPHSVVLLDEIEKAHDDVLNILLQIMEDGVLTDGKGRTVSFKNTVLVMTSNIGSHRILELARRSRSTLSRDGASEPMMDVNGVVADLISDPPNELNAELGDEHNLYPQLTQVVKEELEARMKPELLNRIDEIVVFSPLRRPELIQIASLIVNRLVDRAVKEQDLQLTVGSCVLEAIVQEGSEKADQFGARPMRRAAQRFVEDTLSDAIIRGFLSKGDEATLTLKTNQLAVLPLKQNVVLTRKRDGQELVVEVEDSNGGIDGVTSSPYGRVTESGSLAETSRSRN